MLRDYLDLPLTVRILCLGSLVNRAGSFVVIFLTIYASEHLGFGVPFATACMGALGVGSIVGSVLGGHLADRYGRKIVMLVALFGGAISLLGLGLATNRWAFMAAVAVFSMLADLYRPAASAMIADVTRIEKRPHAFALMYISINLGFAIAPPVGGFLADISFSWLFVGDALTMSVYGLIIALSVRESLPAANDSANEDAPVARLTAQQAFARIAADKTFVLYCTATLLLAIVFLQGISTLPIYIRSTGISNVSFGLLMSINGVAIVLLQLPMTQWLGRFPAINNVICGGALIGIGFGLTAIGSTPAIFAFTIAVWTLGEIIEAPFKQAIVTDMAPEELRGRYLGAFSVCFALSIAVGAPLGGYVLSRFGPQVLWGGACSLAFVAISLHLAIAAKVRERSVAPSNQSISGSHSSQSTGASSPSESQSDYALARSPD